MSYQNGLSADIKHGTPHLFTLLAPVLAIELAGLRRWRCRPESKENKIVGGVKCLLAVMPSASDTGKTVIEGGLETDGVDGVLDDQVYARETG